MNYQVIFFFLCIPFLLIAADNQEDFQWLHQILLKENYELLSFPPEFDFDVETITGSEENSDELFDWAYESLRSIPKLPIANPLCTKAVHEVNQVRKKRTERSLKTVNTLNDPASKAFLRLTNIEYCSQDSPLIEKSVFSLLEGNLRCCVAIPNGYYWNPKNYYHINGGNSLKYLLTKFDLRPKGRKKNIYDPSIKIWVLENDIDNCCSLYTSHGLADLKEVEDFFNGKLKRLFPSQKRRVSGRLEK